MSEAGDNFYAAMLSLDAVLLLVLVVENRVGGDDTHLGAWGIYLIGQTLIIGMLAATVALASGGSPFLEFIVYASAVGGLFGMVAAVQALALGSHDSAYPWWLKLLSYLLPLVLGLLILL